MCLGKTTPGAAKSVVLRGVSRSLKNAQGSEAILILDWLSSFSGRLLPTG
jgi:hypothetical protein